MDGPIDYFIPYKVMNRSTALHDININYRLTIRQGFEQGLDSLSYAEYCLFKVDLNIWIYNTSWDYNI